MSEVTAVPLAPIKKGVLTRLFIGIALAGIAAVALAWTGTSKPVAMSGTPEQFLSWHKGASGVVTTPSGLQYQVIKKGEGPSPTDEDVVLMNYKGSLTDGKVFDQAEKAPLPVNGSVPGFSEALKLMSRGAVYKLWLPPALGYGANSPPGSRIPPNSVLVFQVELVDFRSQAEIRQQMMQQQMMQQGGAAAGAPPPR